MRQWGILIFVAGTAVAVLAGPGRAQNSAEGALNRAVDANRQAAASQKKVNDLTDGALRTRDERFTLQQQLNALNVYNQQLGEQLAAQDAEIAERRDNIDRVVQTARELTPLMLRMLAVLEAFIEVDAPFFLEERRNRVKNLRTLMGRADVTDAERYRKLLEAYQIEKDYGHSIEAYEGNLEAGESGKKAMNFLRVGRMLLIAQSLDESNAQIWDPDSKSWKPLDPGLAPDLKKAFAVAKEQRAPDLLRLPVPAPRGEQLGGMLKGLLGGGE